ncbi:hypothetical protein C2E25_00325 [Geothermobacter hydrogeniphilus]|uniref:DUF4829 domain-containing protein n=1 Tax=Geothermobacter hydrogeniphilus TaxID=1969733 RepID=A0A2K2HEQ9_9BACT|nr:hypothetical protein [Geothermobacter hydrogeniphilus]PNU21711.1 hypothetical protein C2E25_00325 [Geothermobacter hydrogeniphilus]
MSIRLLWLLFLLPVLVGCAGFGGALETPRKTFESDNVDFMQRLRWKDINGAAQHVAKPRRKAFRDLFVDQDDLKITDVRLDSVEFSEGGEEVDSTIVIEYYRLPSTRVRTRCYELHWTFFNADQPTPVGWQITSDIPPIP